MSYSRIRKVIQDYPVGFQTINQARDNIQAIADAYVREHHIYDEQAPRWRHWAPTIPKASGMVTSAQLGTLPLIVNVQADGATVERLATGIYIIRSSSNGPLWADADPIATSTEVRRINTRPAWYGGGPSGVFVLCYELTGGDFVLTDYGFTFTLFGYGG